MPRLFMSFRALSAQPCQSGTVLFLHEQVADVEPPIEVVALVDYPSTVASSTGHHALEPPVLVPLTIRSEDVHPVIHVGRLLVPVDCHCRHHTFSYRSITSCTAALS